MEMYQTNFISIDLRNINIDENARVLDVGGGGEGIISQIFGKQVVAIDNREDELSEISGTDSLKLVMDATNLSFLDNQFDVVTVFFSFMYIDAHESQRVISEISRVLKPGGKVMIWDINIPSCNDLDYDVFIAQVHLQLPDKTLTPGYGVGLTDSKKDMDRLCRFIESESLVIDVKNESSDGVYFIVARSQIENRSSELDHKKLG